MMFRLLPITLLLIVSLASISNAGLNESFDTIAVYDFESSDEERTMDSGPREMHALLLRGAQLSENGKFGNCLLLEGASVIGDTDSTDTYASREFAIVAWVKLPPQVKGAHINFMLSGYSKTDDGNHTHSSVVLGIHPEGYIQGAHIDFDNIKTVDTKATDQNISNDIWHHIAFSRFADIYTLFIDGESVAQQHSKVRPRFTGDYTAIMIGNLGENKLVGSVFIDEVAFLEESLSAYEIKGLYNDGLDKFLEIMPVNPQGRMATTWGKLKSR